MKSIHEIKVGDHFDLSQLASAMVKMDESEFIKTPLCRMDDIVTITKIETTEKPVMEQERCFLCGELYEPMVVVEYKTVVRKQDRKRFKNGLPQEVKDGIGVFCARCGVLTPKCMLHGWKRK